MNLGILCSFCLSVFCNLTLFLFGAKTFNYFKNKDPGYTGVWGLFSFLTHLLKLVPTGTLVKKPQGSVTPTWKCAGPRQSSVAPAGTPQCRLSSCLLMSPYLNSGTENNGIQTKNINNSIIRFPNVPGRARSTGAPNLGCTSASPTKLWKGSALPLPDNCG